MEALTAVAVAALTLYDMVKAVDKTMVIGDIELIEKKGGQSRATTGKADSLRLSSWERSCHERSHLNSATGARSGRFPPTASMRCAALSPHSIHSRHH